MSNRPIADHDTPDPWLIPSPHHPGLFYLTFTLGNRIEIWSSDNLESFHDSHPALRKTVIWQPPPGSPWSADIWAPELHFLFGTWWVYAAAAPPAEGNKGHRTVVLRCTDQNRDPMNGGSWVFEGPMRGLPNHQWSIDATVFSPDPAGHLPGGRPDEQRRWYVCYSGWPLGDYSDTQQDLFLAKMKNPLEVEEGTLTCIGRAELPWERPEQGRRGVNEGPTWVSFPGGQWRGIVYSGHGSWTWEYKLGLLQFMGGPGDDLCSTKLWRKRPTPLLVSDKSMGAPFGPGHASFVSNPGDDRVFCVYHGNEKEDEGWNNRKARVLCMGPDVFMDGGRTMCCAHSVCGPVADHRGPAPGQQPGYGPGPNQPGQNQSWQQHQQPQQNMGGYGQPWQQGQGQNQSWQGQPPPQSQYPGQQSQSQSQYPGQQQQQNYPPPPPMNSHPSQNQQPQLSQSHSPYPGGQQNFQPPPQQSQGYPSQSNQIAPGQPSQQTQNYYQPGQPTQQPQQAQGGGYPGASGSGSSSGGGFNKYVDKYGGEIQKRIPAQYQGYFEKAKKFLK